MTGPVLFFDGVCNLCQRSVQFIIRHDRAGRVRFASLQSQAGKAAITAVAHQYGYIPDSLILQEGNRYYIESAAAIRVARYLDGAWSLLQWLRIFPRFLRDPVYRLVARYRYRWFGRQEACMLPTPALKTRFIEDD